MYVLIRNYINQKGFSPIQSELIISSLRLVSAGVYLSIFIDLIKQTNTNSIPFKSQSKFTIIAFITFLSAPLISGTPAHFDSTSILYIATSFAVGIREEISFRGVLQTLLGTKLSSWLSIIISTLFFVLMHTGFQPMAPVFIFGFFFQGLFLALVYRYTSNLILCIILHSLFDINCIAAALFNHWGSLVAINSISVIADSLIILSFQKLSFITKDR